MAISDANHFAVHLATPLVGENVRVSRAERNRDLGTYSAGLAGHSLAFVLPEVIFSRQVKLG